MGLLDECKHCLDPRFSTEAARTLMRWWGWRRRIRVLLVALNALALAGISRGGIRMAAAAVAAVAGAGIARSLRCSQAPAEPPMIDVPSFPGSILLGRGFRMDDSTPCRNRRERQTADPHRGSAAAPDELLGQHLLILGTTGTGKTRCSNSWRFRPSNAATRSSSSIRKAMRVF